MKQLLLILVFLILSGIAAISQSTLPNGGLNDWYWADHPEHPSGGFWEPGGGFFMSLNILDTIPLPAGLTCYRTDTVHSGSYAARVRTSKINALDVLIPGVIGTLKINWVALNATLGIPYTYPGKAGSFQGWYKAAPLAGDSAGAVVLLSKWNQSTNKRDTIGYKRLVFLNPVSTYTYFDAPIDYIDPVTMPDSITLLLLACAGYNASNMLSSVGQVGSQAWFDDITLTDVNGFQHLLMPETAVKLYPNPASDEMTVELDKVLKNGKFIIYSAGGKEQLVSPLANTFNPVSVSSLIPGSYYYKVTDGNNVVNTGSFMISK